MEQRPIADRSGRTLACDDREADDVMSKSAESKLRGYVRSVGVVVATVIFLIWANVPNWLHSNGIHYHPLRYWVAPMPNYVVITIVVGIGVHIVLNLKDAPPPTTLKTIFDGCSEELILSGGNTAREGDQHFTGASLSDLVDNPSLTDLVDNQVDDTLL